VLHRVVELIGPQTADAHRRLRALHGAIDTLNDET
jgi:hypothetical protein